MNGTAGVDRTMSIDQDTGQSTTEAKATGDYLYAAALCKDYRSLFAVTDC